ncbi:MAG TPA: CDP-diacylglycerol--glycerol-3-phosphate 3-phosphatidyltransferase [Nevskiaceae bacterium]|nr:CDP-diacylglycerol--glycerol-3-phosphate 3-phosphatidyltransferase [Nevskiaceae bacterium]
MRLTLPLWLTILRVAAIPAVLALFYVHFPHSRQWACVLYAAACITDWFDGYLARLWGQTSKFGAFLDPVADKLMVAVCLVMLLHAHSIDRAGAGVSAPEALMALLVAIIIGREITISALREWMAELGSRARVSVSWVGKVKTAFQMTSIGMMIWRDELWGINWYALGYWLLFVAAALTIWSMAVYLRAAWPMMRDDAST